MSIRVVVVVVVVVAAAIEVVVEDFLEGYADTRTGRDQDAAATWCIRTRQ